MGSIEVFQALNKSYLVENKAAYLISLFSCKLYTWINPVMLVQPFRQGWFVRIITGSPLKPVRKIIFNFTSNNIEYSISNRVGIVPLAHKSCQNINKLICGGKICVK
jgi:hypothetical protein